IGAECVPQIKVYNKADRLADPAPRVDLDADGQAARVWCSAATGDGMPQLLEAVDGFLGRSLTRHRLQLPPSAGRVRARLFDSGRVLDEQVTDSGDWLIEVEMPAARFARLARQENLEGLVID
ncbi:MAG TPA: GTPase HflX, partial [Gammaproteobacteria bacterium]